jgi:hypothetical protein
MTFEEIRDCVADMVAELLTLSHGFSYETVMNMYWTDFSYWHRKTVDAAKRLRGIA